MTFSPHTVVWITIVILAIVAPRFTAQPPTAEDVIELDRQARQTAIKGGRNIATKPKWGFFGTIFNLILEQVNDTKSAYNQISDLVNGQFVADNIILNTIDAHIYLIDHSKAFDRIDHQAAFIQTISLEYEAPTKAPPIDGNGTTETPKITRSEFLKILDRNLKGLNRLRNLEWREARKDSAANMRAYKDEIFRGKKTGNKR